MPINFSFSLLLSLVFLTLPFSHASIKAQNGGAAATVLWCVAKNNAENAALQGALDWACGPGGADCSAVQQGGPCYDSQDIQKTASFAFNDYYLKHGLTDDSCYFDNTAALTSLNPSYGNCKFPSSATVNNGSISGSATTIGMGPTIADMNGCYRMAHIWLWPWITGYLFSVITLII